MANQGALFPGVYDVLDRILRPLEAGAAILAGLIMLTAMCLTTADALLRYTINSPLNFNYFLTEYYLMVGLVCMPMAWAFRTGGYIRISFLVNLLPVAPGNLLIRLGLLICCVYVADLAVLSAIEWYGVWESGAVEMGVIDWPWSWSWIWVPVGLSLLAVRLLLAAIGPAGELKIEHDDAEDGV